MRSIILIIFFLFQSVQLYSSSLFAGFAKKKVLIRYAIDPKTGELKGAKRFNFEEGSSAYITYSKKHHLLIGTSGNNIMVFKLTKDLTPKLVHVAKDTVGGNSYISVDDSRDKLISAVYGNGYVVVYDLSSKGKMKRSQLIKVEKYAHGVFRKKEFVYVPHTGVNSIYQFKWDSNKLVFLDPKKVDGPTTLTGEKITGPRHGAFHPSLNLFYSSDERSMSVSRYKWNSTAGQLKPIDTTSTIAHEKKEQAHRSSDIRIHPSGKMLYVANRGPNTIACIALDKKGAMTYVTEVKTGNWPRYTYLTANGKFFYSTCQRSKELWAYKLDEKLIPRKVGVYPTGAPGMGLIEIQ